MKIFFNIAVFATLAFISQSCSEDVPLQTNSMEYDNYHNEDLTRASGGSASDLYTNWENMDNVTLNNGSTYMLPWHPKTSSIFEYDYRNDIKKEDGWA